METENIEKVKTKRKGSRKWITLTLRKIPASTVHESMLNYQDKINHERRPKKRYTIKQAYVEYLIEKVLKENQLYETA